MRPTSDRNYVLFVLTTVLVFNFIDRVALGVVLQDVKLDLHLSDTELGLLSGIAFALFYSVMGLPIARWADRGNRVLIISITAVLWSVAVASCALAHSLMQLMLIRIAVAVGEAGTFAPAMSLISDRFSRAERPRAAAIYTLAWPLSCVVGYFLAGRLNQVYGWRLTFILLGLPGLLLAGLVQFTVVDPRHADSTQRAVSKVTTAKSARAPDFRRICRTLWANRAFRNLMFFFCVSYFFAYGITQWQPTFFVRSFHLTSAQVGTRFALIYGGGGILGTYLGVRLASQHARHNEQLQLSGIAIAWAAAGVLSSCVYLSTSQYMAFGMLSVVIILQAASSGPLFATMQTLVPESMRAVSVALVLLFANLIGMGLGPLTTGGLSDAFHVRAGGESLRYALLTLSPGYLLVGWFSWRASRSVRADLARVFHEAASRGLQAIGEGQLRPKTQHRATL